jgi:hypothetical protein
MTLNSLVACLHAAAAERGGRFRSAGITDTPHAPIDPSATARALSAW